MPYKPQEREYRSLVEFRAKEEEEYIVEGYATTFDSPYVLFSDGDTDYLEQVSRDAFDGVDTKDCVFLYNHEGMVFARTKNETLQLSCDDHGLKVRADLSKTAQARDMYETIKAGLVTEMSFAFTVKEDEYDKKQHLRTIKQIGKLYDVSAVSIPANPQTEISARSHFEGFIEAERLEQIELEQREIQKRKIKLMMEAF